MKGIDLFTMAAGLAGVVALCLLPPRYFMPNAKNNVWWRSDFKWWALVFVLLMVFQACVSLASDIQYGRLTMTGLIGPLLLMAAVGVFAGRTIELGRRFGREPPDSPEAENPPVQEGGRRFMSSTHGGGDS